MQALQKKHYSEKEYLELEKDSPTKHEFYRGELFAMAGASLVHNSLVANLIFLLMNHLKNKPCRVYPSDLRVKVELAGLYTYPDVSIFCNEPTLAFGSTDTVTNPTVILEVLSDSTEKYDRGQKFHFYRQLESLQEYVLVSSSQKRVEVFQRLADENWLFFDSSEKESITIKSIECDLSLKDVYYNVSFLEEPKLESGN